MNQETQLTEDTSIHVPFGFDFIPVGIIPVGNGAGTDYVVSGSPFNLGVMLDHEPGANDTVGVTVTFSTILVTHPLYGELSVQLGVVPTDDPVEFYCAGQTLGSYTLYNNTQQPIPVMVTVTAKNSYGDLGGTTLNTRYFTLMVKP